jgi:hypothetical protein
MHKSTDAHELYQYSDNPRDVSNCVSYQETLDHYEYVVKEVIRLTKPGRLSCVHCTDLKRGILYQWDFPGDLIKLHEKHGMHYFCRTVVWKDPWEFARRTRMKTLMHMTIVKDSATSRIAPADHLCVFLKPGINAEPITHERGFRTYPGSRLIPRELREYLNFKGDQRENRLSHWIYRQLASPVWMDIRRGRMLPFDESKEDPEERHVCLARNNLVLTKERGYIPIQDVIIGDHVLTHKGRWRAVLAVQQTGVQPVIRIGAQGVPSLIVTPDHRLWCRKSNMAREREGAERVVPQWIEAQSSLSSYVNLPLPSIEVASNNDIKHWWIVGRWLACGHWAQDGLHISYGDDKREDTLNRLGDVAGFERHNGSCWQVRLHDPNGVLRETMQKCGHGAADKHLPPEAFILPESQAKSLLDGYLAGDGHFLNGRNRWAGSSVSRSLALGIAFLAQRVYRTIASVYPGKPEREEQIEGRTVHCQQVWVLSFDLHNTERYKKPFILEDGAWKKVRSIEDAGEQETWNIRVEEDESYVAEGCVVKNCALQLDFIERCLMLWSNPGDIVLDPFAGVGSTPFCAVKLGRRSLGCELKPTYYRQAIENMKSVDSETDEGFKFDITDDHEEEEDGPLQTTMFGDDAPEWLVTGAAKKSGWVDPEDDEPIVPTGSDLDLEVAEFAADQAKHEPLPEQAELFGDCKPKKRRKTKS